MRTSRLLAATLALAVGLIFAEAATRPAQEAHADSWEYYISPQETGCEGCCSGGPVLCCASSSKCRIPLPT